MRMETPRDLFVYELGLTRNLERMGDRMLSEIAYNIQNRDLADILHQEEECRHQQAENIDACLKSIGVTPLEHYAPVLEGLRERFFNFTRMRPSPAALDLYVLGTTLRFVHLVTAGYRELVELAHLAGETECCERLQANLEHKQQYEVKLVDYNRELGKRLPVRV